MAKFETEIHVWPDGTGHPDHYVPAELPLTSVDWDNNGLWIYVNTETAAADERARIVWWLRAGCDGPAAVNTNAETLAHMRALADVIEAHPERFADAPTRRSEQ